MAVTPSLFRYLLAANLALVVAASSVDALIPALIPDVLSDAYGKLWDAQIESYGWLQWILIGGLSLILIPVAIASYVGLFLLRRWGRRTAVLSTLLALLLYIPLGPVLQSGWSALMLETSMMMWGAILAMAHLEPLNAHFEVP